MCVFEHPQWQRQVEGGGEVWEECRGQGPLLPPPSPLVLPSLLCLLFLGVEIRCQCSRVRLMFAQRGKRFVCFRDCQQTSLGGNV